MAYCYQCFKMTCICTPSYLRDNPILPDPIISRHLSETRELVTPGATWSKPISEPFTRPIHGPMSGPMANILLQPKMPIR
jgi:hypothetical protein